MIKLIIEFVVFGCLGLFFTTAALVEWPNAVNKKTRRNRTFYQRWQLAHRRTRWGLLLGIASGAASLMALLQLIGVIPSF